MSIEGRGVAWKGKEVQPGGIRQKETGRHCLRQNSQTGRLEVSPGRKIAGLQSEVEPKRRQEKAVEAARKKHQEREAEAAREKRQEREAEAARKKLREKEAGS